MWRAFLSRWWHAAPSHVATDSRFFFRRDYAPRIVSSLAALTDITITKFRRNSEKKLNLASCLIFNPDGNVNWYLILKKLINYEKLAFRTRLKFAFIWLYYLSPILVRPTLILRRLQQLLLIILRDVTFILWMFTLSTQLPTTFFTVPFDFLFIRILSEFCSRIGRRLSPVF